MRPTIDASSSVHSLPLAQQVALDAAAVPAPFPSTPTTSAPPTVLFVDQSGQLGGAEFALLQLAGSCVARSEVVLLADGPFRTRLEALGARVHIVSDARVSGIVRSGLSLSCVRAVPGLIRQVRALAARARRFDVLFLNTQKALVLGALGKPLHRRPVIWYQHDILSREHFGRVQLSIVKWLVRLAVDQVVANSKASAQSLAALTGLPVDAIPVIYNGIDSRAFNAAGLQGDMGDDGSGTGSDTLRGSRRDTPMGALRRRLGLPEHVRLAGLFGRLAPWKGQHIALDALARLPDVHLVLVGAPLFGEDAYAERLHRQAARLGITDRVHFAGFQDGMPAWMKAMDVILHTSTEPEPFGRVIVEGMAAGRPVIASAAGGVTEIVRHGENGWLVPPGDAAALAEGIEVLLGDAGLALRLAEQGAVDAREGFSVEVYLRRMMGAIGVVGGRG